MRYATLCSGVEAPSLAWSPLGWKPIFFSEVAPFPSAVLAHHYPSVPNLGDMKCLDGAPCRGSVDLVCGGTPCQSFSIAGSGTGLDDDRGKLVFEFFRVVSEVLPRWVIWENVPNALPIDGGRAFGSIVGALEECGYGWAYRTLDAQYVRVDGYEYAVPQRRRRVFVVGYLGDWRPPSAILFEPESLRRHSSPRKEPGPVREVAPTLTAGSKQGGGFGTDFDLDGGLVVEAYGGEPGQGFPCVFNARQDPTVYGNISGPLDTVGGTHGAVISVAHKDVVRRLTPLECERLQGMPDDYTLVQYRGKPAKNGPRYKAIGNSMAVNVMRWIGRRIQQFEDATC